MAMASRDSLKQMVMQFRISELQSLLAFAGEPIKFGKKKKDLQRKAISLITSKRIASLHNKICLLYQNLTNKDQGSTNSSLSYPNYKEKYRDLSKHILNNWSNSRSNDFFRNGESNSSFINEMFGGNSSDNECGSSRLARMQNRFGKLPVALKDIEFKSLPFFEYQSELLAVTTLHPKKIDDDVFECGALFTLDSDWISRLEPPYQVQMRMCTLTGNTTKVSDSLPLSLCIKVNDKYSTLPPPIPSTNRQGMLLRRMNVPINITSEVHRKSGVNKLEVSWSIEDEELYAFTIHIVKKFTSDELIDKLKLKGERDPAITRKAIIDNLNDEDNEIAATSLKISLVCPLGKILITLPTRATTCNHLQCFDGTLFIKMNDVKSTWQCPVCNQSCFYEDLFIDGFFCNVLKSESFVDNVTEIEVDSDASWIPVLPKKRKISDAGSPPPAVLAKKQHTSPVAPPAPVISEPKNTDALEILPTPPPPPSWSKRTEVDLVSDGDSSNDVANDLQDFYYQYNKDAELCSYRAGCPILPSFKEMSNHFLNVKTDDYRDVRAAVPIIVSPEPAVNNNASKKNILEVDLTETDSDSGEVLGLSDESDDNSYDSDSSYTPPVQKATSSGPPCYDIDDSDSDF